MDVSAINKPALKKLAFYKWKGQRELELKISGLQILQPFGIDTLSQAAFRTVSKKFWTIKDDTILISGPYEHRTTLNAGRFLNMGQSKPCIYLKSSNMNINKH